MEGVCARVYACAHVCVCVRVHVCVLNKRWQMVEGTV